MTRKYPTRPSVQLPSLRVVISVVLAVIALVFIIQNDRIVTIKLLIPEVTMPLWVALAAMLLIGVLIGTILNWRRR